MIGYCVLGIRAAHQLLDRSADGDALPVGRYAEGHADWDAPKDGKQRLGDPASPLMRK